MLHLLITQAAEEAQASSRRYERSRAYFKKKEAAGAEALTVERSHGTAAVLRQQVAILEQDNDAMREEVDSLLQQVKVRPHYMQTAENSKQW